MKSLPLQGVHMGFFVKIWKAFLLSMLCSAWSLKNVNTWLHVSQLQDKALIQFFLIIVMLPESTLSWDNSLCGLGASVLSKMQNLDLRYKGRSNENSGKGISKLIQR